MYIEAKIDGVTGNARIGRVTYSKSGQSIYYSGKTFAKHRGFKSNYYDIETGDEYWISGCKKNGSDALYPTQVLIDDDVRDEYWRDIRKISVIPDEENIGAKYRK